MHPWDAAQLATFLGWAEGASQNYPLWTVLAMTGMRRGEALALRWRDVDLEAGTLRVRRSAGMVRNAGEGAEIHEGDTKSGKRRVIDLDEDAVTGLRAHRKARGAMALGVPASCAAAENLHQYREDDAANRDDRRDDLRACQRLEGAGRPGEQPRQELGMNHE
jgi:integrase